jgi:hypothetical protein
MRKILLLAPNNKIISYLKEELKVRDGTQILLKPLDLFTSFLPIILPEPATPVP